MHPEFEKIRHQVSEPYLNVLERWIMWDTVAVHNNPAVSAIPGWFTTLNAMGSAGSLSFFNQRSKSIGLPYNNLDKKDTAAFPFILEQIGVSLYANSWTGCDTDIPGGDPNDAAFSPDDQIGQIFCVDLPRHASCVLNVMQDERLRTIPYMLPPGFGPCGSGYGRGAPSARASNINAFDHHMSVMTQGRPTKNAKFPFPAPIGIPRNGNFSLDYKFNEFSAGFLKNLPGGQVQPFGTDDAANENFYDWAPFYGITVSFHGYRLVQQRAKYHA